MWFSLDQCAAVLPQSCYVPSVLLPWVKGERLCMTSDKVAVGGGVVREGLPDRVAFEWRSENRGAGPGET